MINTQELTGQTTTHVSFEHAQQVHRELLEPLVCLCETAYQAGFDLCVASGFRSFERQLHIWNTKALGQRPVLDAEGRSIDVMQLNEVDRLFAILRWSALPGASRHHWGSDIDIYDAAAIVTGYSLQLSVEETQLGGPFAALHRWLDVFLSQHQDLGFFRPYGIDRGGVAPEPWHLSFAPVARRFQEVLDPHQLAAVIAASDLVLKEEVLTHMEEIFQRFIWVPWEAYPAVL